MERCTKCILPAGLPGVVLDHQRVCVQCRSHASDQRASAEERRERLGRILSRYRNRGAYDALVPVSGGKDSMYVLYLLTQEFGLTVLAYNFDNGFQSERARLNIQHAVKRLGVELFIFKPSERNLLQLYRTFLIRAGEFCTPCNMMIGAIAQRIARQNRIHLIALGGAAERDSGLDGLSMSHHADRRYYRQVIDDEVPFKHVAQYVSASPVVNTIRRVLGVSPADVDVLDFVHPGTAAMQEILAREIGWEPPSGELEHGDCRLNPLKDYVMNRRWGFSEVTPAYSALVRIGEITRDEALATAEQKEQRDEPDVLAEFLERTGTTREEFAASAGHHFTEFPNYRSSRAFRITKGALSGVRRLAAKVTPRQF